MQFLQRITLFIIVSCALLLLFLLCFTTPSHANTFEYTVASGDTLYGICMKFDVSYSSILYNNFHIVKPNLIYVGDVINIPIKTNPDEEVLKLFNLINEEREKNNLSLLILNEELSKYAVIKSRDMAQNGYFSHYSANLGSPLEMLKSSEINFNVVAENIALGPTTPLAVHLAFMNSEGHAKNVLGDYKEVGLGLYINDDNSYYWTELFIK